MKTVNAYFAMLVITIFGALAASVIVRVAERNHYTVTPNDTEASYAKLQQSLLAH